MGALYDEENFTKGAIPTYLKREVREVIEIAIMFGWKMHISGAESVTIVSPGERKKYHFSASGRTSTPLKRVQRDVIRYAAPEKLLIADSILGIKDRGLAEVATAMLPMVGDKGTVVDHRPELEKERERMEREKEERRKEAEQRKATPAVMPKKAVHTVNEKHIVSEKPMMAKAREGQAYESRVAIERHWSDGSVDYKCVDCEYTSTDRLSIRGHRTRKDHQKRGIERLDTFAADVPNAAAYRPNKNRVAALAAVLEQLLSGGEQDPETLAREALTWVHEQSRKGTSLAEEREPLGPEDVLNRIRALLDDGTQVAALEEQAERIATLEARLEQAEAYAIEQAERAEKATQTLNTFIELASELRAEEKAV